MALFFTRPDIKSKSKGNQKELVTPGFDLHLTVITLSRAVLMQQQKLWSSVVSYPDGASTQYLFLTVDLQFIFFLLKLYPLILKGSRVEMILYGRGDIMTHPRKDKIIVTLSIFTACTVTKSRDACPYRQPNHTLTCWCRLCSLSRSCCLSCATVFSKSSITSEA